MSNSHIVGSHINNENVNGIYTGAAGGIKFGDKADMIPQKSQTQKVEGIYKQLNTNMNNPSSTLGNS